MPRKLAGLLAAFALLAPPPAAAWTRPGHMVTAAIAYDELTRARPELLPAIAELLDAHPDRGPFQVAIDRTSGTERARRMFLECARWPDDARQTPADRASWHGAFRPVVAPDAPAAVRARAAARGEALSGEALQALDLNVAVLADPRASKAERAQALCWVLHVEGDIHQPLHTAELYSAAWPDGDVGGTIAWVRDPLGAGPVPLHWLWDDSVHRSGTADSVDRRAREIEVAHPRAALPELAARPGPYAFAAWVREESYPLAVSFAYGAAIATSATAQTAPAVPRAYWDELRRRAEVRAALAGYRIADTVAAALDAAARRR